MKVNDVYQNGKNNTRNVLLLFITPISGRSARSESSICVSLFFCLTLHFSSYLEVSIYDDVNF
jgi:hypothetical protein